MPHDAAPPPKRKDRPEALAQRKARNMAASCHAFVRGNAELFYELLRARGRDWPTGPAIWISGDCHGENIGAVADAHGTASLELNDMDEAVIADPAFDVIRLALSVAVATRGIGFCGNDIVAAASAVAAGYAGALERVSPSKVDARGGAPERFRTLLHRASKQTHEQLLDHRVPRDADGKRVFSIGERYWPLSAAERDAVIELVSRPESRALVTTLVGAEEGTEVTILDVAFRIAGTGSLGAFRAAALVAVGAPEKHHGHHRFVDDQMRLLDVKEALGAHAPIRRKTSVPRDDAERIVTGARALAPAIGERMLAAHIRGVGQRGELGVLVRELMPQDLKVSIDRIGPEESVAIGRYLGAVVGRAHGHQLSADDARAWRAELLGRPKKGSPDPAWLWALLPDLIGAHESAYLQHCARLAASGA
jgi:uncharacterized protein (DUF2252 family)